MEKKNKLKGKTSSGFTHCRKFPFWKLRSQVRTGG